ncbi:MAG: sigma factor, partial [Chitinophaga rupis]
SIAYNILGTTMDAEDMVQETYISWLNSDKSHVEKMSDSPSPYTLMAIDTDENGTIANIYLMANPQKIRYVSQ